MTSPGRGRGARPSTAQQGTYVLLRLAGPQNTSVRAINPHTPEAQVALRIGTTLIYADSLDTAVGLHKPFETLKPLSRRLPKTLNGSAHDLNPQPRSPSIAFEFSDNPDTDAHIMPGRAHEYFRVVFGQQLGIEVYDLEAFGTVMSGFTSMRDISRRAFPAVAEGVDLPSGLDEIALSLGREIA